VWEQIRVPSSMEGGHCIVFHVHDDVGNVIEAHEDEGDFKES